MKTVKFFVLAFLMLLASNSNLFADQFAEMGNIVGTASNASKQLLGTTIVWGVTFGLFIISVMTGMVGGYKVAKKQAQQDQEQSKIWLAILIGGVVGAILYTFVISILGWLLTGDSGYFFDVIHKFFKSAIDGAV